MFGPPPESKLFPSEKRLVRIRTHWATLSKITFLTTVTIVILILLTFGISSLGEGSVTNGVNSVLWYLQIIAVLHLAYHVADWWKDRVFVTDQRFLRVHGLLKIHTASMPRTKVTDFAYTRTLMGRILGYGALHLESAGQKQDLEYINYIPNSDEVVRAMFENPQN